VGRTAAAATGALAIASSALYWLAAAPAHPAYLTGFLPGLILGGVGAGLTQAPLFAAAGSLPADRTTTGSAVLNMSRQVGSALGVAILVALLGRSIPDTLSLFQRGWVLEVVTGAAAALSIVIPRARTSAADRSRRATDAGRQPSSVGGRRPAQ
jgi:uncharacterized membrane protein